MNGKQAKMLRKVRSSRREVADWKTLTANEKGLLRRAFNAWEKLAYMSYANLTAAVLGRAAVRHPKI